MITKLTKTGLPRIKNTTFESFLARFRGLFVRLLFITFQQMFTASNATAQSAVKTEERIPAVVKGLGQQYFNVTGTRSEIARLRSNPDAVMALVEETNFRQQLKRADMLAEKIQDRPWSGFGPGRGGQWWQLQSQVEALEATGVTDPVTIARTILGCNA